MKEGERERERELEEGEGEKRELCHCEKRLCAPCRIRLGIGQSMTYLRSLQTDLPPPRSLSGLFAVINTLRDRVMLR